MKGGFFLISVGALIIGLSGDPSGGLQAGLLATGIMVVALGIIIVARANKKAKRIAGEEKLAQEESAFRAEQEQKRMEEGKKKEIANVEKSRKNSAVSKGE